MLAEPLKLEGVFGCQKALEKPTASNQVLEVPDESNVLFGVRRILKEPKVSNWCQRDFVKLKISSDVCRIAKDQRYHLVLEEPWRADGLFGIPTQIEEPWYQPVPARFCVPKDVFGCLRTHRKPKVSPGSGGTLAS